MKEFTARIETLQAKLKEEKLEAMIVSKLENIRYLTNFSGSTGFVVVTRNEAAIFVDFRYIEQAKKQTSKIEVIKTGNSQIEDVAKYIKDKKLKNACIEADSIVITRYELFEKALAPKVKLVKMCGIIEEARMTKSKSELALIKKAVELADVTFNEMISKPKENIIGKSESDIAAKYEYLMKIGGAQCASFESIIAFGPNSAYPHYKPSPDCIVEVKSKAAGSGQFLKMDFGAKLNGYCSDMTRTVIIGKPSQKHLDIYKIVLEAQLTAISKAKPGMTGAEIDKFARDVIAKYGYADNFGHGLGHGGVEARV